VNPVPDSRLYCDDVHDREVREDEADDGVLVVHADLDLDLKENYSNFWRED
jgi:hypothetical protein